MIPIQIPGKKTIEARHLVLDFNGTLAIDGSLIEGTRPLLELLSNQIAIHVVTADTFETAEKELAGINCSLKIINANDQDLYKEAILRSLGCENVIAIGNGLNDGLMLRVAALGIAVIQKEGAAVQSLFNADLVCLNILDALELILNSRRIAATLRK